MSSKEYDGWNCGPDYQHEERTSIPEALGLILVGGTVVCIEKVKQIYQGIKSAITSLPEKGIEKIASKTIKGIGGLEDEDID